MSTGIVVLMGSFLVMMIAGVPIAFSLALAAIIGAVFTGQFQAMAIVHRMIGNSSSYTLLAIPFFILAAKLMNTGGITRRIFRCCTAWIGWVPGGLGHANVLASIVFSGMSGSAVADAGGLGQIEIDAMMDEGFDPDFSAAVTVASATIGPIIPPSIPMVVYGMMTEVSVGTLFIAGIVPGLLLALATCILVYIMAKRRNYPKHEFDIHEAWDSTKHAILSLLTPVIIIGGIWTGLFSPTEAACVAVIYAFFLSVILYHEMTLKDVYDNIRQAVADSAGILVIVCGAAAFSWLVTMMGATNALANFLANTTSNKYLMLLFINVAFLLIGMFMEALAAMTITIPFLIPLMSTFGFNPVHLGVVIVLNLMIGLATPPVGTSLFICARTSKITIERMYRAIVPFLIPLLIVLLIITYIPATVTFLPSLFGLI